LRCPLCKKIFEHTGVGGDGRQTLDGRRSAFSVALSKSGDASAGGNGTRSQASLIANGPGDGTGTSTILSDADEAMLREFGSGSGLLELTREAYVQGNPGDVNVQVTPPPNAPRHATAVSPVPPPTQAPTQAPTLGPAPVMQPQPQPATGRSDPDSPELERQFTVVSMALTMANKLVLAHKAELTNVRSNQRLAWTIVAVLAVVFLATAWWGMDHRGKSEMATSNLNLEKRTAETSRMIADERSAQFTKANADLTLVTETLKETQGENLALKSRLATTEVKVSNLETEVKRAKTDTEQARIERDRALNEAAGLQKEIDKLKPQPQTPITPAK